MRFLAAVVVGVLLVASPAAAQQPITGRQQDIVEQLAARHPVLAFSQADDDRRALTRMIIEQLVFEFPSEGWGGKAADSSRPFSKDSLARQIGTRLYGCDWQNGGTRAPHRPVMCDDITGQVFIPVPGINHLPAAAPAPGPAPSVPAAPVVTELGVIRQWLAEGEASDERQYLDLAARLEASRVLTSTLLEQLEAHDKGGRNPVMATLGNRWVQLALELGAAYYAAKELQK